MVWKLKKKYRKGFKRIFVVDSKVPGRKKEYGLHLNKKQFNSMKKRHKNKNW